MAPFDVLSKSMTETPSDTARLSVTLSRMTVWSIWSPKKALISSSIDWRILGPFVEKGSECIYSRGVSDLHLDEFDHPQKLTDAHKGKGAHIDGDDDLADGSQGIEGEKAEARRTIDDDVFVR